MTNRIEGATLDQERALYHLQNAEVDSCTFSGPADGESALKECRNIVVKNSLFDLRYPLWHLQGGEMHECSLTEKCRAALWYCSDVSLHYCNLGGIKAVRECSSAKLANCNIVSPEFGWQCRGLRLENCTLESEYAFLHTQASSARSVR